MDKPACETTSLATCFPQPKALANAAVQANIEQLYSRTQYADRAKRGIGG